MLPFRRSLSSIGMTRRRAAAQKNARFPACREPGVCELEKRNQRLFFFSRVRMTAPTTEPISRDSRYMGQLPTVGKTNTPP